MPERAASRKPDHEWGFRTRALHAGGRPDPATGARAVPFLRRRKSSFIDGAREDAYELSAELAAFLDRRATEPSYP